MSHIVKLPRAKPVRDLAMPGNLHGSLTLLGVRIKKHRIAVQDKEHLLYDAKAAFRELARKFHSDLGGTDESMRAVLEAFRFVKAYCTRLPQAVPRDPAYERRIAQRDLLSQL